MSKTLNVYYRKLDNGKCAIYRSVSIKKVLDNDEIEVTPVIKEWREESYFTLPEKIRLHCDRKGGYGYGYPLPEEWYEKAMKKEISLFDLKDDECGLHS
jgi:hypothetical protein